MGRAIALFIVCMLSAVPISGAIGGGDGVEHRSPSLFSDVDSWGDDFSDTNKVYIPPGGLVGVEVVGGEVRLKE